MEATRIYERRDGEYKKELDRVEKEILSQRNKELILQFRDYLLSTGGCGEYTASKRMRDVRHICELLGKDLDKATKEDALRIGVLINQGNFSYTIKFKTKKGKSAEYLKTGKHSFTTRQTEVGRLKRFFKWFKEDDSRLRQNGEIREEAEKFYKTIEKLKASGKTEQIDPKDVLTEEDVRNVLDKGCRLPRDKAFISMLHETGCRIGEFLGITLSDYRISENYAEIFVNGKTGRRSVYVVKSLPYLIKYLDVHPNKYDKNSFMWISEAEYCQNQPINYIGAKKLVERCFARAKINKKCNLHWFRHSRASILAPSISEPVLCKAMGWSLGTKQYRNYTHLCSKQVENVMLEINGIKQQEDETEKPIKCICGTLNNPKDRYCFKCYKPLSVEVAIQDNSTEVKELKLFNKEAMKTMQSFMEAMQDPEFMKKFEEFKRIMGDAK